MDRRRVMKLAALAGLTLSTGWLGCGPSQDAESPGEGGNPRNAHKLAAQVVGAKVTMLIYMDRVRVHDLAPRLAELDAMSEAFQGTDIDPMQDVDRAFVAARNAKSKKEAIAVAEHHVTAERVRKAMDDLVKKSGPDGQWLTDYPVPAAKVKVRNRKSIILAVTPTLLVVTSPAFARPALVLQDSGGLPEPTSVHAIIAHADEPASSLKAAGAPEVPPTVRYLDATLLLRPDGGADLAIDGESTDEVQARVDAETITKDLEAKSTVDIAIFKFQAFEPIPFTSEGQMVKARRRVTKKELDRLISLAAFMLG